MGFRFGRDPNMFKAPRESGLSRATKSQDFQVLFSHRIPFLVVTHIAEFKVLRLLPACREHLAAAARAAWASATYFGMLKEQMVPTFWPKPACEVCFHKLFFLGFLGFLIYLNFR